MKSLPRIGLVLFVSAVAVLFPGCYPRPCAPNDTSCLPCPDPRSTNSACSAPLNDDNVVPLDAQRKDGGTR